MLSSSGIRARLLMTHGALAVSLGLVLLFLGTVMTNLIFEVMAVVVAVLVCATGLVLGALSDLLAAYYENRQHGRWLIIYLSAGLLLVAVGAIIGVTPEVSMRWLLVLGAAHAVVFGAFGLVLSWKARHHPMDRTLLLITGSMSLAFGAWMGSQVRGADNRSATLLLGLYLSFLGGKMFVFAWNAYRLQRLAEEFGQAVAQVATSVGRGRSGEPPSA